ncbi:hypothetical protein HMPREF9162_0413 [Selenomonas sp. oral taxon 137 str. F0430]|nr:hypothetical protein HMPREF9162_0413 [Selenomonas sp. oral taxon 137 str. F0430]
MKHLEVRELVRCGIFIALITVGSWIRIPVGTDVYTLQFLFTLLAGLVLGARLGAIAVGAYVLLGLVGVPVFAMGGGRGISFSRRSAICSASSCRRISAGGGRGKRRSRAFGGCCS